MRKASNAILWDAQQKRKSTDIGCVIFPTLTAGKPRPLSGRIHASRRSRAKALMKGMFFHLLREEARRRTGKLLILLPLLVITAPKAGCPIRILVGLADQYFRKVRLTSRKSIAGHQIEGWQPAHVASPV
jgi:hypothetical protein